MAKKHSRRMSKKHHGSKRKHHSRRYRMRGGDSSPASVGGNAMAGMMAQSLAQGQQYEKMHANQHGGADLVAGEYPGAVEQQSFLNSQQAITAKVAPLDAALNAIKNMGTPGMAGGRRRNKKSRKASKKSRKATKKSRKASKKSRKSRKSRKMRGGAAYDSNPASVNAPGMLLNGSQMRAALSGMNAEWKLAENPAAFAPGVAKNY